MMMADGVPLYGWKVQLDHEFREKRNGNVNIRLSQLPQFLSLAMRYLPWYIRLRRRHIKPIMDGIRPVTLKQIYGVPMGGIGSGTIGRGFKGEFCRFQLYPGLYQHHVVKSDVFIVCVRKNGQTVYQQVLSPKTPKKTLSSWKWGFPGEDAEYTGLYPQSWTVYYLRPVDIILVCKQLSPVIPHDYKDSCLPVAVFRWEVLNNSHEEVEVSIVLTFKNGTGSPKDAVGGRWNESFTVAGIESALVQGVMMHQNIRNTSCTVAISAMAKRTGTVSHCVSFNPRGSGKDLWLDLEQDGCLNSSNGRTEKTVKGQEIACAVCSKICIPPNAKEEMHFSIVWDMPKVSFRKAPEVFYIRRYTRWFGSDGNSCPQLASYALKNFKIWENKISSWQKPILEDSSSPDWYKSAIFNELYFVSDGGSVWVEHTGASNESAYVNDVRPEFGRFAYLEGHEYRMYNTYDVHFYASFAIIKLWPKIQLSIQYDVADCIQREDKGTHLYLAAGHRAPRKVCCTVPHDVGDPDEAPWEQINAYCIEDTNNWKDLNLKFVLQLYRDYVLTSDEDYLRNLWPFAQALISKSLTWDQDGDGLIENSGVPDQTYDTWRMSGPSAYCGGLWLAALFCMSRMARRLGCDGDANKYEEVLERGKSSFHEKLWNGKYYNFDCSSNYWSNSIMSDQLCGHWYLRACGHAHEVFQQEHVMSALHTIYQFNVKGVKNGKSGAANGMRPNGLRDLSTIQSEEIWIGVTYALASTMIFEGLVKQGFSTAEGMYRSIYERLGMAYQTPEAIHPEKHFRSLGYMRPLSIWSIQAALDNNTAK